MKDGAVRPAGAESPSDDEAFSGDTLSGQVVPDGGMLLLDEIGEVSPEAMKVLNRCDWPGNVREPENCIERTATMVQGDTTRDVAFSGKHKRCERLIRAMEQCGWGRPRPPGCCG